MAIELRINCSKCGSEIVYKTGDEALRVPDDLVKEAGGAVCTVEYFENGEPKIEKIYLCSKCAKELLGQA